ncbi:MAG: c-type cytochrome, partial [Acidobacteriota bacterium]|nr:c-type cytochrome [Acidobacteriota bacterium]
GTAMPKFGLEDDEMQSLVMYVQSLRKASPVSVPIPGDPAAGKRIYNAQGCSKCHEIANQGGTLGPDLTRVGAARSYQYLQTSLVDPSADIPAEYETVQIVTRDGKHIQAVRVNEDSFTIQVRFPDESFASFDKQTLKELVRMKSSVMPVYRLGAADQQNLLAYLSSLTGEEAR